MVTSINTEDNGQIPSVCDSYLLEQEKDSAKDSIIEEKQSSILHIKDLNTLFLQECKHSRCDQSCGRVTLNVSGLKFQTLQRTLNRLPNTLLGNDKKRNKFWDPLRREYFFDRHRPSFGAILYFYQSGGRLVRPPEVHPDIFLNEIKYFEMGDIIVQSYIESEGLGVEPEYIINTTNRKETMWTLIEHPDSSKAAKCFAIINIILIMISVTSYCVETLPQYRDDWCVNVTTSSTGQGHHRINPNFKHPLSIIEVSSMSWFTVEIVLRFLSCPSKSEFFKHCLNWIDIVTIVPYFIQMFLYLFKADCYRNILLILRVLGVVRTLKLTRHFKGLQLIGITLKAGLKELYLFVLCFGISVIIFSFAIYYAEQNRQNTRFTSIPATFWWAVITMTTVGYGDMYPEGTVGKIIGVFALFIGITSFAFPLHIIISNFNKLYVPPHKQKLNTIIK